MFSMCLKSVVLNHLEASSTLHNGAKGLYHSLNLTLLLIMSFMSFIDGSHNIERCPNARGPASIFPFNIPIIFPCFINSEMDFKSVNEADSCLIIVSISSDDSFNPTVANLRLFLFFGSIQDQSFSVRKRYSASAPRVNPESFGFGGT